MELITLTQALKQMNSGKPFQLKFVTCNQSLNTGGEIIELKNAFKIGAKYNLKNNDMISLRQQHNEEHHPYPVHIHLIVEFNNQKVVI